MDLAPQIRQACDAFIPELMVVADPGERAEKLTAFIFGNLTTLAAQIDDLRSELRSKGIDLAS